MSAAASPAPGLSDMRLYVGCEWGYALRDILIQRVEEGLGHDTPPPGCWPVCNHIFVSDGTTVIEAAWPRVHRIPLAKKDKTRYRLYKVPCKAEQASGIWQRANDCVGDWYDVPALLLSLWYIQTGQQSKWYGNAHASIDCVEMADDLLRGTYPTLAKPPSYDWSPALFESRIAPMFERVA